MVDHCGGTTRRTTSGFGPAPSRTGNPGERVGAIDIHCPQSHPICPNGYSVGSQATASIGYKKEDTTLMAPQPLRTQSTTTPAKSTQSQQLQVGDHIYIKNNISHSD